MLIYCFFGIKIFLLLDEVEATGIVPGAQKSFTLSFFERNKTAKEEVGLDDFCLLSADEYMSIYSYTICMCMHVCIFIHLFFLHHFFS